MLRVIAMASPQTRIEGRPASATAPRDRIAGFKARRRVEMWTSTNRISTLPRRTKNGLIWSARFIEEKEKERVFVYCVDWFLGQVS
jgi:hypothetical protein